jgi:DNA polymerase-3 subunit delta
MAIVFEEALKKDLASKELSNVYILFGTDGYLKKTYAEKIGRLIAEPDDIFNYCKFSSNSDLQEVYDAVMQFPFASDRKFVLLDDFDFEHCSKNELDKLNSLLSDTPDTAVLVLRFDNIEIDAKKNAKFKGLVASAEKSGGKAVCLDHRTVPELIKMLSNGAAKRGLKMDSSVAKYLVETAGEDINLLSNELIKLCSYQKEGIITKETVDLVCSKTVEASVYNLSKLILASKSTEALSLLDELLFMRIEPMSIFYNISSVYVDMFRMYAARNEGIKIPDVAQKFSYGNRKFLLENAERNLRNFDFKRLSLSLNEIIKADSLLKSFRADERNVLEQLIVRLIYIIEKGELVDKA